MMSPAPNILTPSSSVVDQSDANSKQGKTANLIEQGLTMHKHGKYKDAQIIFEQVLNVQPNHFDALQLLGVVIAT